MVICGVIDKERNILVLIANRGTTAGAGHPTESPELCAKRGDQVRRVLGVIRLYEMVVVVGGVLGRQAGGWRGHIRC